MGTTVLAVPQPPVRCPVCGNVCEDLGSGEYRCHKFLCAAPGKADN